MYPKYFGEPAATIFPGWDQGHPTTISASPEFLPLLALPRREHRSSEIAAAMNGDLAEQLSAMELIAEQPHTEQQPGINQPLDELPMPPKLRAKPNRRSIGHAYENEAAFVKDLECWNAERAARALLTQHAGARKK